MLEQSLLRPVSESRRTIHWLPFVSLVCLIGVCVVTRRTDWLAEGEPTYAALDLFDVAISLLLALALGAVTLSGDTRRPMMAGPYGALMTWLTGFCGLASVALILVAPNVFNALVLEDNIAENASAGLLFVGSFLAARSLFARHRLPRERRALHIVARLVFAVVLSLIALEEVSWFQRLFEVRTPGWLQERNIQYELNFHNTQTSLFENLYYLGVAALLVGGRLIPGLRLPRVLDRFAAPYVPQLPAFVLGALACALNFDMWNQVQMQVAFFLALVVTLSASAAAVENREPAVGQALLGFLVLLIATQVMLLAVGHRMVRVWDATELRETVIAFGLFVYAVQIAPPGFMSWLHRTPQGTSSRH